MNIGRASEAQRHRDEALRQYKAALIEAEKALAVACDWSEVCSQSDVKPEQKGHTFDAHQATKAALRRFDNPEVQRKQDTMKEANAPTSLPGTASRFRQPAPYEVVKIGNVDEDGLRGRPPV